jgi:hypothetical protein
VGELPWDEISEAVVLWTGWKQDGVVSPDYDEARVIERFGWDRAAELLARARELEADFYATDAHSVVADHIEMVRRAADEFRVKHPHVEQRAVDALGWCYSFDYK